MILETVVSDSLNLFWRWIISYVCLMFKTGNWHFSSQPFGCWVLKRVVYGVPKVYNSLTSRYWHVLWFLNNWNEIISICYRILKKNYENKTKCNNQLFLTRGLFSDFQSSQSAHSLNSEFFYESFFFWLLSKAHDFCTHQCIWFQRVGCIV